jgi:hypothetical protein
LFWLFFENELLYFTVSPMVYTNFRDFANTTQKNRNTTKRKKDGFKNYF